MVSYPDIRASNSQIASTLPKNLVAVFVGGTNGVGEAALKAFAKYARNPRIYNVGRSQEASDRIADECKALNPDVRYCFIKADTSLLRNVDDVCRELKSKETAVNILFLSIGCLISGKTTAEGLDYKLALTVHSRARFITNLLPLLHRAPTLRRVVSTFLATKEGPISTSDLSGRGLYPLRHSAHTASLVTCTLEAIAQSAPDVAFVHGFPGFVKSGIGRGMNGLMGVLKVVAAPLHYFLDMELEEVGERHLFYATSARYPAAGTAAAADGESPVSTNGVPLRDGLAVATGTTGANGGGVYSVNYDGESAGAKVVRLLAGFREDGTTEEVWGQLSADFVRITGVDAL